MHIITRSIITAAALGAIGAAVPAVAQADIITDETTFDGDLVNVAGSLDQGAFLDSLAAEDAVNQLLLGSSATASETAVLSDWSAAFPDAVLPKGDTLPAVGATGFDTSLITLADGEFANAGTSAVGDVTGLLPSLGTDATGLLTSLPTDVTGLLSGGGLTDLTTLLPDLLSGLGL